MTASRRKSLGRLLGSFKTVSTNQVNVLRGTPEAKLWQRDFHDRVIRNERELNAIRDYIFFNPANWRSIEAEASGIDELKMAGESGDTHVGTTGWSSRRADTRVVGSVAAVQGQTARLIAPLRSTRNRVASA